MSYVMVAMAGAGLLKSELVDRPAADRQRKLAAQTQEYSPWTGLKAGAVKEADPIGSALAFGGAGAQVSNGLANQKINQQMADAATAGAAKPNYNFNAGGGSWSPQQSQDPYSVWGAMGNQG
jgi:hypothetical protein